MLKIIKHINFTLVALIFANNIIAQTYGCTDPLATNYNSSATHNDGSCTYNSTSVSPAISLPLPVFLEETSGLIFWNNKIWTHNDDTDINIYSFEPDSIDSIQLYPLTGTINNSWEEISQDADYIYIGDFGNNSDGNRTDLKILRIEKNSILENCPIIDTILFEYSLQTNFNPTGPNNTDFDCESFIVSSDSIYLFTKEWVSEKTSIYSLSKQPGNHIAQFRGIYNINGLITGATYLKAQRIVVLTGYSSLLQPFLLLLYDFNNYNFFSGNKRKISINSLFHQVEGIATEDGLWYYVSNEKFEQSIITIDPEIQKINLSDYLSDYINMQPSDINKTIIDDIVIYPNPASKTLTIELSKNFNGVQYSILDINGRILTKGSLNSNIVTINIDNLEAGMYIFKTNNNIYKRFVKR